MFDGVPENVVYCINRRDGRIETLIKYKKCPVFDCSNDWKSKQKKLLIFSTNIKIKNKKFFVFRFLNKISFQFFQSHFKLLIFSFSIIQILIILIDQNIILLSFLFSSDSFLFFPFFYFLVFL